ncbi:dTMP kinase [Gynuella sunshinyii]|uniref:Thymidylate kinase n=1 Tax=Gynuella sunshinyii YC6258 TaxID=1445510 RepID=A0A0C5V7D7_9GAMM|nr:dTMP kinase [Gynuella sunshinyii]AJQ95325.1 thymidylate kinase [Gynuella sunshinyii YC6258]
MTTAQFITLEGVEGVGKSTNLEFICSWLTGHNIDYIVTREPGGTPLAEELRNMVLSHRDEMVDAQAELLMVFAARAQHLNTFIKPHLAKGTWVISDRFTDASFAYQGAGRGISIQDILSLEQLVQKGFQPDLTIYLDCPPEIGLARACQRAELDRIEREDIAFFERVRAAYLERAAEYPDRFEIVDASVDLPQVQGQISHLLQRRYGSH